ncbi:hypothetical protein AVEN_23081-1 [Araneus ventricosus]|uniref:Uncharacterized protein n=1 Tax=Araneus ventricosus TaxID=182803 RepID=A0A4Y2UEW6_ARAVE|nr:hypothetical protein AVEN_23081-1 [Araneus ventricosus]
MRTSVKRYKIGLIAEPEEPPAALENGAYRSPLVWCGSLERRVPARDAAEKTASVKVHIPLLFVVDVVGAAFAAVYSLTGWIADGLHPAFTGNPFIGKHTNVGGCLCCS